MQTALPVYRVAASALPIVYSQPTLRLNESFTTKLTSLLTEMKSTCNRLPQPHQDQVIQTINEWEDAFFRSYYKESLSDNERKMAAIFICYFMFNIEYVLLHYVSTDHERVPWAYFLKRLLWFVSTLLPSNLSIDPFIAHIRRRENLRKLLESQEYQGLLHRIHTVFDRLEQELVDQANRINENLESRLANFRRDLLALNTDRRLETEALHGRIDSLSLRVDQLFRDFKGQLKQAETLENKSHEHELVVKRLLEEMKALLNKV